MRVAFISRRYFPAISGMSIYAENLLRELVAQGHDVTLISQYYGDPRLTRVYGGGPPPPVPGVKVIGLEALGEQDGGDFERDIATIAATVEAEHARAPFDILHAQYGYPTGFATLLASQRTGVPNLVSIQGGDGHWVGSCCETHRLAMIRVIAHAGALLIGGASFIQEVADRLRVDPARFTIVPGAVDTTRFHPADGARAPGPLRLLYHGRVDRRKGVLDFLDALARLHPPHAPHGEGDRRNGGGGGGGAASSFAYAATISGIGPDFDAAQARAAELGLPVRFTGYAAYDDVPAIYRAHDIFVSPTYAEGFSNTILEAMASGLPVLSCHAVGVSDCLRHDENALLTDPGDVLAQAAQLTRLLTDAPLRARLAAAALNECRRTYSWTAVGRQIAAIYDQLRGNRPDPAFDPALPLTPCRFRAEPHLL